MNAPVLQARPIAADENGRVSANVLVVVPAHRAAATLRQCIAQLRRASGFQPLEVVVVYDDEAPLGVVENTARFRVTETSSDHCHSAGAARNFGARFINDGIIVFLDSDVLIHEDALMHLLHPIVSGHAAATVGNYSDDVRGLSFLQAYKQLYIHAAYGRRAGPLRNEFWTGIGAIRADVFHQVGGFNSGFRGACGEDLELGQRLTGAGFEIWAVPKAKGRHLHAFTYTGLLRNDLLKGISIMLNALRNRNQLSDNRHTSAVDVAAVSLAYLTLACAVAGLAGPSMALAFGCLVFAGWVGARSRLFSSLKGQGAAFLVKSIPIAFSLDLVRGLCVAAAILMFLWQRHGNNFAAHYNLV